MGSSTLTQERRSQLSSIVEKMEANKETTSDIQLVVDHFKTKYSDTPKVSDSVVNNPSVIGSINRSIALPITNIPDKNTPSDVVKRVWDATKETFVPSGGSLKRLFNPNAGQFGVSKVLQEEGMRVGKAVRSSGDKIAEGIATSRIANVSPSLAAGIGTGVSTLTDLTSDALTPSSAQQSLGVDVGLAGLKVGQGPVSEKLTQVADDVSKSAGRRGLGFIKSQLNRLRRTGGVERADSVAAEMIKQKVVTPLATPSEMLERARALDSRMLNKIGTVISKLEKSNLPTTIDALSLSDEIGRQLDMVAGKGATAAQKSAIQEIVDRVLENAKPDNSIGFADAQNLKDILQQNGNWSSSSDAFKADAYRRASGIVNAQLRKAIGHAGRELGGDEGKKLLNDYLDANLVKGKTQDALNALTQLDHQKSGNKFIDNLAVAGAIGGTAASIASGHGTAGAVASASLLLGKKFIDSYGAQLTATGFKTLSNLLRANKFPPTALSSPTAARAFVGMLNRTQQRGENNDLSNKK